MPLPGNVFASSSPQAVSAILFELNDADKPQSAVCDAVSTDADLSVELTRL